MLNMESLLSVKVNTNQITSYITMYKIGWTDLDAMKHHHHHHSSYTHTHTERMNE